MDNFSSFEDDDDYGGLFITQLKNHSVKMVNATDRQKLQA